MGAKWLLSGCSVESCWLSWCKVGAKGKVYFEALNIILYMSEGLANTPIGIYKQLFVMNVLVVRVV